MQNEDLNGNASNARYASVRLLDSPYHLDNAYDYRIPDSCRGIIRVGSFVILPYGNGNRRIIGVVCDLSNTCAYPDAKIKSIDKMASERLSADEEMLSLAEFIKNRCLCTFGDALKLMLPPGALSNLRESVSMTARGTEVSLTRLSPDLVPMLAFIKERGTVSKDEISLAFPRNSNETLERLITDGYVQRTIDISETNDAYRTLISLTDDGRYAKVRGDKQKAVISYLGVIDECEISLLSSETGAGRECIKGLIAKGFLSERRELIHRDLEFLDGIKRAERCEIKLNEEQEAARRRLTELYEGNSAAVALLHGVTGSGKTSVMLGMIDRAVADGKGVIVLLPEIALTPQTFSIFASRYENIALIHSGLSQAERHDAYMRIRFGDARVVIGTRSAIFAPVRDLGLIIIDEEHEHTYKSDMSPRYHARDIAKFRCAHSNALLILASATPDIESYYNAKCGKYALVTINKRYGNAALPEVMVVDVKSHGNSSSISPMSEVLMRKLDETMRRGEQAIIFINRRGFNSFFVCGECGEVVSCPSCDVSLTYHTKKNDYGVGELRCHICGHRERADVKCRNCGSERFIKFGYGTQRVEKEIGDLFPERTVIRMDTDSVDSDKNVYFEKLTAFRQHEADILLGTSMITKGHDFPDVTLVGVLLADASLRLDDYRASERTYAMITQVIGRAGRADKKGLAVIQAMNPESEVIKLACDQDYGKFYEREIELRRVGNFPPYCDIALFEFSSEKESILLDYTAKVGRRIRELKDEEYSSLPLVVYGPFEAPVYRAEGKYRMRIIIKCRLNKESRALFSRILTEHSKLAFPSKPAMSLSFGPTSI